MMENTAETGHLLSTITGRQVGTRQTQHDESDHGFYINPGQLATVSENHI